MAQETCSNIQFLNTSIHSFPIRKHIQFKKFQESVFPMLSFLLQGNDIHWKQCTPKVPSSRNQTHIWKQNQTCHKTSKMNQEKIVAFIHTYFRGCSTSDLWCPSINCGLWVNGSRWSVNWKTWTLQGRWWIRLWFSHSSAQFTNSRSCWWWFARSFRQTRSVQDLKYRHYTIT